MTVSLETRDRVVQQAGALSTAAVRRLEADLDWYRDLSAAERSWIGLVAHAGVAAFVGVAARHRWCRARPQPAGTADIFANAPRELTRTVSLGRPSTSCAPSSTSSSRGPAAWPAPATSSCCARRCCASPARSPSRPPRSMPAPPRPAARGTPASRPSSSTPSLRGRGRRLDAVPGDRARAGARSPRDLRRRQHSTPPDSTARGGRRAPPGGAPARRRGPGDRPASGSSRSSAAPRGARGRRRRRRLLRRRGRSSSARPCRTCSPRAARPEPR